MNNFYGVNKIGQNFLINQLETNIKSFLRWGFISTGGFVNVFRATNNVNNNALYKLQHTNDPNYNNGQVWQTIRKDWVYESGVDIGGYSPIPISGIYINDVFYDTSTTGQYQYKIDYKNSRIIFDNRQSTSLNISMNYSYNWVQIYNYSDAAWWQELQYNTNNNSLHSEQKFPAGDFALSTKYRTQMPAIIIETVPRGTSVPFMLGNKSMRIDQDFIFHIIANNYIDRNNITDILRLQEDKVLYMYNLDKVIENNVFDFNFDGTLNNSRLDYMSLINNVEYYWNTCRLKNMIISEVESINADLFECNIRTTAEIIVV